MIWPLRMTGKDNGLNAGASPEGHDPRLVVALTISVAIVLGVLISLLGISSLTDLIIALCSIVALVGALWVFYSGVRGQSWAISLYLFILAFIIEATFRRRGFTESGLDAQTLFKLLVLCGAFMIGVLNFNDLKRSVQSSIGLRWLLLFALWTVLTTTYSITPSYTFAAGFAFIALICFISMTVQKNAVIKMTMPVIYACGLLTLSAVILYFTMPSAVVAQTEGGRIQRLAGLTGSPNNLGRIASIGLLFIYVGIQSKLIKTWRIDIVITGISALACIGLSWSRTSMIALTVSIGLIVMRKRVKLSLWLVTLLSGALLILVVTDFNWDNLVRLVSRRGSLQEIMTLTGRTAIWDFIWREFLNSPILGYGYGSTKLLMPMGFHTSMGWTSTSAHNMLLQTLVTTGLIGAVLVTVVLLVQARYFVKRPNDIADALFIYVLVSGIFEPGAVGLSPNLLTIIWIISLAMPREANGSGLSEMGRMPEGRVLVA